jgi:catechol 2,3-dioxygenase-like lactoylglutathione lyase family enzyme
LTQYDRTIEDVGNVVLLEHVNTRIPDQQLATLFYVSGLGLTRDPYLMTGVGNMWINVGKSQFHLPTGQPQVVRGHTGLVIPNRETLVRRLAAVKKPLEGSRFSFKEHNDYVEATCPWGNRIRCYAPGPRFGRMNLGMPYVELEVPPGTADGIVQFYRKVLGTRASAAQDGEGRHARVSVGAGQDLIFRESEAASTAPAFDGHHIAIYLADFSGPYRQLLERGLITEESDQHQYRFQDILDLNTGKVLFTIEHEVRSMRHPLYARPLVSRNPEQTNRIFAPGHEELAWSLPAIGG